MRLPQVVKGMYYVDSDQHIRPIVNISFIMRRSLGNFRMEDSHQIIIRSYKLEDPVICLLYNHIHIHMWLVAPCN